MRLAACIVNYRSGAFALACARWLQAEWQRSGGGRAELDLVVVDNGAARGLDVREGEPGARAAARGATGAGGGMRRSADSMAASGASMAEVAR